MTKFVRVVETPVEVPKDAYVIQAPNFLEEIAANKQREPAFQNEKGRLTALNHLRFIVGSIGLKYDQELTAYTVRPHLYEGRYYKTDSELSDIVVEMLTQQYPQIFDKYLDVKIKSRPANTKLIYYVGTHQSTTPFFNNGIDQVDEDEADSLLNS